MHKASRLLWAGLTGLSLVAAGVNLAGCRDTTGTITGNSDFAQNADLSGIAPGSDLAVNNADMATGSVMSISDMNKYGVARAPYTIQNAVVTGVTRSLGPSGTKMVCQYEAYVQDKDGTAAPNGIRLYAKGQTCATPDGGGSCFCPFPPNSGTPLDGLANASNVGDVYTITGTFDIFKPPASDGGVAPPPQHELVVATMTMTGTGATVTPATVDAAQFAVGGQGFVNYENTLVEIKPAAKSAVSNVDLKYYNFNYAGAYFGGSYRFNWTKVVDMGYFLRDGAEYSSIVGIAMLPYGGNVAPRAESDFKP